MKTKNIFKVLALAMMMPTMLLTTACSNEDDFVNNNENNIKQGYALPVTVNVTRQGDATTRASFDESTHKLSFSSGDQLFVSGIEATAGKFAGTLTWQSGGTFSGTLTTENEFTGTAQELLTQAYQAYLVNNDYFKNFVSAILLPADYNNYEFITLNTNNGYDATISTDLSKTFALTKAAAVEQFSLESTSSYSNGFTLYPSYGILNFTITGLTPDTDVNVTFSDYTPAVNGNTMGGTVHTDGSGNATFAVAVYAYSSKNIQTCSLYVNGNPIALVNSSKPIDAGHIYNITRSAVPPAEGHALSTSVVGEIVGSDGNAYAVVDKGNLPTGVTAVAMVAYKSGSNGLAIALTDETGTMNWTTAKSTCEGKTAAGGNSWHLPSQPEWKQMFAANGGDEESFTGLNTAITTAGGTGITNWRNYWTSSLDGSDPIYIMIQGGVYYDNPDPYPGAEKCNVRACLGF